MYVSCITAALHAQVCQPDGEVIITNDGATILNKMSVIQPAAKMLVELAKAQAFTCATPYHFDAPLISLAHVSEQVQAPRCARC